MTSDEARIRAEKIFKKEEREREGRAAMSDYEARGRAVRANMARLRAIRLAALTKAGKKQGAQSDRAQAK